MNVHVPKTHDPAELLEVLEALIVEHRGGRYKPDDPSFRAYHALKAVAADVRHRSPVAVSSLRKQLSDAVERAHASRSALGYETGKLRAVAELVIGRWPAVRQALDAFGPEDFLPMADAPHDREILLRVPCVARQMPAFRRVVGRWFANEIEPECGGWKEACCAGYRLIVPEPTGWFPLNAPTAPVND